MYNRICDDCWEAFSTKYNNVRLCWDCQRLKLLREHPSAAVEDEDLNRFAFDNGLVISRDTDGTMTVKDIFEYEDKDEQWRSDLAKIKIRHKLKRGRSPTYARAWDMAAKASHQRAAAKHPDMDRNLKVRAHQETPQNGEVRIIKPARKHPSNPARKDETGGADDHRDLGQHPHVHLQKAV